MGTRILATSDLHGHLTCFKKAVEQAKPEIAVVAGDMINMGLWGYFSRHPFSQANAWVRFCREHPETAFIMVPGNHERLRGYPGPFHHTLVREAATLANLYYLDNQVMTVQGIRFYGGERYDPDALPAGIGKVDIAVFHYRLRPGGNGESLSNTLSPDLVVHGHDHTGSHGRTSRQSGSMMCLNVSSRLQEEGEGVYGYYLIDYVKGGPFTGDWVTLR